VPNIGIPNFIKHTLLDLKTQIDPNTVKVGNFNCPDKKINKEVLELNDSRSNGPDRHLQSISLCNNMHPSQQPMELSSK
jgi:hypothetical protein